MIYNSQMNKNILLQNQNTHYKNLIFEDLSNLSFYTQNKQSYEYKQVLASDNKWGRVPRLINILNILTDNLNEVYDFCGGKHNKESYNFLIDLKNDCLIDNVRLISPKSYYPTVLNIYFGNDKEQVFDKTAVPVKEFKGVAEKGDYNYSFDPKFVRYIRIEILDNINTYFGEMLVIPISFLGVFGYKNVYTEDFSKNIRDILANTKTKYITLLQPYLYRTEDGTWVNSFNKQTEQLNFNEIPSECLGESYIEADFKISRNSVNIGLTNNPDMIFKFQKGVNFSEYIDISLCINSPIDGALTLAVVPVDQDSYFDIPLNVSCGWQRFYLRSIMPENRFLLFSSDTLEQNFQRLQISPDKKKMIYGNIIVGSIVARRYVDWKSKGLDLDKTNNWSFDKWVDIIASLELSDVDTTELDLFLNSYREYSSIYELKEERK